MSLIPGVGGHLFPASFLASRAGAPEARRHASWQRWWADCARVCGPATGARAVFDVVAMPLAARLGYRARDLTRRPGGLAARLVTPRGQSVSLLVYGWRGWSSGPPAPWREVCAVAREHEARWGLVLAPPHLSLVPARGHASRRALDFTFPDVLEGPGAGLLLTLADARGVDAGAATQWLTEAAAFHARVHAGLQAGVREALDALTGVLRRGPDDAPRAFDEALTLVYRILFLLYAESRALVPMHHPLYRASYSLASLCEQAGEHRPTGLWEALAAMTSLARTGGSVEALRVFPFNGRLFSRRAAPTLERTTRRAAGPTPASRARDDALARTLQALATRRDSAGRLPVHYADLGVEQLGAVYEHVLDFTPDTIGARGRHSALRKDTGTFYTPASIAQLTVRLTLEPLVDGASSDRLLELRIVDPAMGSGAFLVAALHFLAAAYERAVITEGRWAPLEIDEDRRAGFRRLIAQRCLFGVDINPTAVGVARLSLWLATMARDKPLEFLEHRLRVGNSLIGATPDALRRSMRAVEHDTPLLDAGDVDWTRALRQRAEPLATLSLEPDDSVDVVRRKERAWEALSRGGADVGRWKNAMDLWCAQWFWPGARRPSAPELRAALDGVLRGRSELSAAHLSDLREGARTAAAAHGFFHWPLEFADTPAFDAVISNPPWEMVRRDVHSARRGAGRDALVSFIRQSALYPGCRSGHLNLYQPFVDRALQLARPAGRIGLVLPWGAASDDGAAPLRRQLLRGAVDHIVAFDNARGLFPIHRGVRFMTLVAQAPPAGRSGSGSVRLTPAVSTSAAIERLDDEGAPLPGTVQIDTNELPVLGGEALRIPDVRDEAALTLLRHLQQFPSAGAREGWGLTFGRELNASDDRPLMQERTYAGPGTRWLPVVEGKHIGPHVTRLDHTRMVVARPALERRLPDGRFDRPRLAYRDVSAVGNTRALIAAIVPAGVITTHTLFCLRTVIPIEQQYYLCGLFNGRVLDVYVRMFMGSHVTASLIEMLPLPPWTGSARQRALAGWAERCARGEAGAETAAAMDRLIDEEYGVNADGCGIVPARAELRVCDRSEEMYRLSRLHDRLQGRT